MPAVRNTQDSRSLATKDRMYMSLNSVEEDCLVDGPHPDYAYLRMIQVLKIDANLHPNRSVGQVLYQADNATRVS